MTRWNAESDRALLFAVLKATSSKIDYKAVAAAWPNSHGDPPTPKAITHRISSIRSLFKSSKADCTEPSQPRSSNGVKRKRTGEVIVEVQASGSHEFLILDKDAGRAEHDGEAPVGVKVGSSAIDNDGEGEEHVGREFPMTVKAESPAADDEESRRSKVARRANSSNALDR